MRVRAVCFDLHGTLARAVKTVSDSQVSEFLVSRGYEVYPQAFRAAWHYVSFVDYPRFGYKTWEEELERVLQRLDVRSDRQTLADLAKLYQRNEKWERYPDAEEAVDRARKKGLRTAIVTTIARFRYQRALKPVLKNICLLADGYTFNCEKSNPRIYLKTLEALNVETSEAVMIGDDLELDVLLPKKLGMKAIFLDRTEKAHSREQDKADAVVGDLNEAMDEVLNAATKA